MKAIISNLAVNYKISGSGKPVLMLHGWGNDLHSFDQLAAALTPKYKVIRVDLPGFGESQLPPPSWTLDNYIGFIEALLKKLKIKQLHAIVGHSLGTRITFKGVGMGKIKTARLVLIGAHGIKESKSIRNKLFWMVAKVGKVATKPLPNRYRQSLKGKLYKKAGSQDYHQAGQLKAVMSNIIREDVRPEAAMIGLPTLLIYGQNDTITPVKFGRIFQKLLTGSQLVVLPATGHFVHQENPEEVNRLVKEFLG